VRRVKAPCAEVWKSLCDSVAEPGDSEPCSSQFCFLRVTKLHTLLWPVEHIFSLTSFLPLVFTWTGWTHRVVSPCLYLQKHHPEKCCLYRGQPISWAWLQPHVGVSAAVAEHIPVPTSLSLLSVPQVLGSGCQWLGTPRPGKEADSRIGRSTSFSSPTQPNPVSLDLCLSFVLSQNLTDLCSLGLGLWLIE
jgi:hypothetical protein